MFGTEEAARIILRELATVTEVAAAIGTRMYFSPIYPGDQPLPGALVYPQFTQYDGPINGDGTPTYERVDMEVRFIADGTSAGTIRAAARAALAHFGTNAQYTETIDGINWHVSFGATGEVPPALINDTYIYRQLGTVYTVEFNRGG